MILQTHQSGPLRHDGLKQRRQSRQAILARSMMESTTKRLLDSFWEARGVLDPAHRKRLVNAAEALVAEPVLPVESSPLAPDAPLPGLPATWSLQESTPEVLAASRRLLALQQMLGGSRDLDDNGLTSGEAVYSSSGGGGGIDVVWMVVREPGLLSADLAQLTGRLLEMKLVTYGTNVDVLRMVEAQPALLLSDRWRLSGPLESFQAMSSQTSPSSASFGLTPSSSIPSFTESVAPSSNHTSTTMPTATTAVTTNHRTNSGADAVLQSSVAAAEGVAVGAISGNTSSGRDGNEDSSSGCTSTAGPSAVQQLVQAWQHGIASDDDSEWALRLNQLSAYRQRHGDTCVGFRSDDDPQLGRWAAKQRSDWRRGDLAEARLSQLAALGFHFDADEAEWSRWFSELLAFKAVSGNASPMPLVTGADMYLINWCSVQRIARRCGVLSDSRIERLDSVGFDWTGADPLS